jgi:hypothetical protein
VAARAWECALPLDHHTEGRWRTPVGSASVAPSAPSVVSLAGCLVRLRAMNTATLTSCHPPRPSGQRSRGTVICVLSGCARASWELSTGGFSIISSPSGQRSRGTVICVLSGCARASWELSTGGFSIISSPSGQRPRDTVICVLSGCARASWELSTGGFSIISARCESNGFGTGRQRMALARCTTPTLPRRTCSPEYELRPCRWDREGVETRRR